MKNGRKRVFSASGRLHLDSVKPKVTKKQKVNNGGANVASSQDESNLQSSQLSIDAVSDLVASQPVQSDPVQPHGLSSSLTILLQSQIDQLHTTVAEQHRQIQELIARVTFITSLLNIDVDVNDHVADQSGVSAVDALNSFATAVKRPAVVAANRAVQESVVAAMYVDNQRRLNRATNIVVSGLAPSINPVRSTAHR